MKEWIRQFYTIKNTERRAIVILSMLVFVAMALFLLLPSLIHTSPKRLTIKEYTETIIIPKYQEEKNKTFKNQQATEWNLHDFDPNSVTKNELIAMGFSEKLATTWTNYTSKGAKFYQATDVKKLYGMNDQVYSSLESYISIAAAPNTFKNEAPPKDNKSSINSKNKAININTADTLALIKLPMIGTKRAQMIVKYRNLLGGFIQLEQLKEVYGLNDTVYNAIINNLYIEKGFEPLKIAINFSAEKDLSKHPYIKSVAKTIASYKKEHGPFESKKDLEKLYGIDKKTLERMLPYINFDLE